MKKRDILGDKSINTIAVENIDKDFDQINIIGDVKESKSKGVFLAIRTIILTLFLCSVVFAGIYAYINMKFVQGNIEGSVLNVGGISMVEKDYSPNNYIKEGSVVYYDGDSNKLFNRSDEYSIGKVVSVTDNKVNLQGEKDKTYSINKSQVQFVLNK